MQYKKQLVQYFVNKYTLIIFAIRKNERLLLHILYDSHVNANASLRCFRNLLLYINMKRHIYRNEDGFSFEAGGRVETLEVAYHTSPMEYKKGMKVIWICHALTADSNAGDWWADLVGPGKLFDTDKYFVVCGNMIGSCYGSSGPSSIDPKTGKPYFFTFPKVTVRDIVNGLDEVRRHIGIDKIDFLVGASIGGFQAFEWSVMHPEIIGRAVYIATTSRISPWASALEESQRMALEADQTFRECASLQGGRKGLECARSIAMISYRCDDGYNLKQPELSDDTLFADRACSYQRYQGAKLADRFDAYSYYYLACSVSSNNLGRGRGGETAALGTIKMKTDLIAIDSDILFPPHEMEKIAERMPNATYHVITSHFGHDGFLLETKQLEQIIRPIVNEL